jgi:hypothetical protein
VKQLVLIKLAHFLEKKLYYFLKPTNLMQNRTYAETTRNEKENIPSFCETAQRTQSKQIIDSP